MSFNSPANQDARTPSSTSTPRRSAASLGKATRSTSSPAISAAANFDPTLPPKGKQLSFSDRDSVSVQGLRTRFGDDAAAALSALVVEHNRALDEVKRLGLRLAEYEAIQPSGSEGIVEDWQEERRTILRERNRLQDDKRKLVDENRQLWKVIVGLRGETKDTAKENRDRRPRLNDSEGRSTPPGSSQPNGSRSSQRPPAHRTLSDGQDVRGQRVVSERGVGSAKERAERPLPSVADHAGSQDDVPARDPATKKGGPSRTPSRTKKASDSGILPTGHSDSSITIRGQGGAPAVAVTAPASRGPKRKASSVDLGKAIKNPDGLATPHLMPRAATPPPPSSPSMTGETAPFAGSVFGYR